MGSAGAQAPPASCSCRVCVRSGASRQSSFTFKLNPKHKYKCEYKYRARLPPQVYPEVSSITGHLQRVSAKVRDQETREDLKTQANMYNVMLTAQIEQRKCDSLEPGKPDCVCRV